MLEIRHLAVRPAPDAPVILRDFNLTAFENEILVLLGTSGSGKTTLLRSIAGLANVDSGSIVLDGIDITHTKPSSRKLSYVSQSGGYYDHWTVERHLSEALRLRSTASPQDELENLLRITELWPFKHAFPHQISGGQLQRLTIARAIAAEQRVVLLDEPIVHLDDCSKRLLLPFVAQLRGHKRTIIYVTHDRRDAMLLADRIAILDDGKILQTGKPQELYSHPASLRAAAFFGDHPLQLFQLKLDGDSIEIYWDSELIAKKHLTNSVNRIPQTAILGIRPELISICPKPLTSNENTTADRMIVSFDASVSETKHLGATSLAYLELSSARTRLACVMLSSKANATADSQVVCSFSFSDAHIFDSETEQAITLDWN